MTSPMHSPTPSPRSARLRQLTMPLHQQVEDVVAARAPFASAASYARFVQMQYLFQAELQALYQDPQLGELFPDLPQRCRCDAARADLADLASAVPAPVPGALHNPSRAQALTWIRVSEGSKLGAAVLIKRAREMGFDEDFGARHLAEPEGGRMRGWKAFNEIFDALPFSAAEEAEADAAACAAFERIQVLLDHVYATTTGTVPA